MAAVNELELKKSHELLLFFLSCYRSRIILVVVDLLFLIDFEWVKVNYTKYMYVFCNQINIKKLLQYHGIKEKNRKWKNYKNIFTINHTH